GIRAFHVTGVQTCALPICFGVEMGHTFFHVDSEEAAWNSSREYPGGNSGWRPGVKGGYLPTPPVDSLHDLRAEMCKVLEQIGIRSEERRVGRECRHW